METTIYNKGEEQHAHEEYCAYGNTKLRSFPITTCQDPHIICGIAFRVGKVQVNGTTLPLYRIRLNTTFISEKHVRTLDPFFILSGMTLQTYRS